MRLRAFVLPLGGLAIVLAGMLLFGDLNGSLVYYLTPSEAVERRGEFDDGRRFRLAGTVAPDSVETADAGATFTMTDGTTQIPVTHRGAPPQLFRDGIEVVVEGAWDDQDFVADTMLIKHDEQYYPPGDGPTEAAR